MRKVPCAECGSLKQCRVTGELTYPHRPDLRHREYWMCDCGAFVAAHRRNGHPMGAPGNGLTRSMRSRAHEVFDPLWEGKHAKMSRSVAYRWLAAKMGLAVEDCHIGLMSREEATKVVSICLAEQGKERNDPSRI